MDASLFIRRGLIGLTAGLILLLLAGLGLAAGVEAGFFRGAFLKLVSAQVGRPIEVAGSLHVALFSAHPHITAEHVIIANPRWMPPGTLAEIGELSMVVTLPGFHRRFGVESLSMKSATLHLERDAAGRANWQWTPPGQEPSNQRLQILRSLSVPGAHVLLADERRHLHFDGTVTAQNDAGDVPQPLKMQGSGELNGRAATFELTGDPLATSSHERPYHFSFDEHSSGSTLSSHGELPQPFDFTAVDTAFEAAGADLRDLYFLAGVSLINTGAYRLSGNFERRDNRFTFSDLAAASGRSDVHGRVGIESPPDGSPSLDVDLKSQFLRMADLGEGAAGRAPPIDEKSRLLLSAAAINPATLRLGDARIQFHARRVEVGRLSLTDLAARGTIHRGILSVPSFSADFLGGKVTAHGKLDANSDPPSASTDIRIADAQLQQYPWKSSGPSPLEGLMRARVAITGKGSSIHEIAASGNGTVTALVPQGSVRDSLAELTGIDLRGLGLLLAKNKRETPLRCAAAVFKETHGTLIAQRLVMDTEPVLITGDGEIRLGPESLDLAIRGQPKSVRLLKFNSPLRVTGTLLHPSIAIESHKIKLIDPGHGADVDCTALMAAADAAGAPL